MLLMAVSPQSMETAAELMVIPLARSSGVAIAGGYRDGGGIVGARDGDGDRLVGGDRGGS